jgi:hypothetical protein
LDYCFVIEVIVINQIIDILQLLARQTEFIQLSNEERRSVKTLFRSGEGSNRRLTRAWILGFA